jgi:hypothetical protein
MKSRPIRRLLKRWESPVRPRNEHDAAGPSSGSVEIDVP